MSISCAFTLTLRVSNGKKLMPTIRSSLVFLAVRYRRFNNQMFAVDSVRVIYR